MSKCVRGARKLNSKLSHEMWHMNGWRRNVDVFLSSKKLPRKLKWHLKHLISLKEIFRATFHLNISSCDCSFLRRWFFFSTRGKRKKFRINLRIYEKNATKVTSVGFSWARSNKSKKLNFFRWRETTTTVEWVSEWSERTCLTMIETGNCMVIDDSWLVIGLYGQRGIRLSALKPCTSFNHHDHDWLQSV